MTFSVQSEVGRLRQAIVHRPGLELSRLTPQNIGGLLFDDVLWAKKAKEEHDVFAETLRDQGVRVHYFGQLLAETLELPEGRAFVLDRVCTPELLGPTLVGPLRELFDDLDGPRLAEYLVGGVLKADLRPLRAKSLKWDMLRADDFLLPPLPNHLFTRDNSCWVYGGVSMNPMAKPARQRESLHIRAVYRYHPTFAGADFVTYYGDDDASHLPASVEGGDVHVLGQRHGPDRPGRADHADGGGDPLPRPVRQRPGAPGDRHRAAQVARDDAPRHGHDDDRPPRPSFCTPTSTVTRGRGPSPATTPART